MVKINHMETSIKTFPETSLVLSFGTSIKPKLLLRRKKEETDDKIRRCENDHCNIRD